MNRRLLLSTATALLLSLFLLVGIGTQTSLAQVGTATPFPGTGPMPTSTAIAATPTPFPGLAPTLTLTSTVAPTTTGPSVAATTTVTSTGPLSGTAPLPAPPEAVTAFEGALERIYTQVEPSVVNVQVVQTMTISGSPFRGMPNVPLTPGPNMPPSGGVQRFAQGLGSGFVWDTQGHIVTNNHVVAGASSVSVTFSDGTAVTATVVGSDVNSDLAVLQVNAPASLLKPVTLGDSSGLKVGQFVVAIGNPFGLQGSMSTGIVSALARSLPVGGQQATGPSYAIPDIIQTDAAINPGNSGGVLTDVMGRVVGVTAAIESAANSSSGVGFAIPSAIVQKVVPVLISGQQYSWPFVGISGTTLLPDVARAMDLPAGQRGALVVDVLPGSPAAEAGLQGSQQSLNMFGVEIPVGGDVIMAINGSPIKTFDDLVGYLANSTQVGQTVTLTILRNGQQQTVQVTLAARPSQTGAPLPLATPSISATPSITGTPSITATPSIGASPTMTVVPLITPTPLILSTPAGTPMATPQPTPTAPAGAAEATPGGGPRLGIFVMNMTPELAAIMNLPTSQSGVLVVSVESGSAADQAGMRGSFRSSIISGQQVMIGGDIITAINGQPVATVQDLQAGLQQAGAGSTVTLTILRDGQQMQLSVPLGGSAAPTATPTS